MSGRDTSSAQDSAAGESAQDEATATSGGEQHHSADESAQDESSAASEKQHKPGNKRLKRRTFLIAALSAVGAFSLYAGYRSLREQRRVRSPADVQGAFHVNALITITPDDRVLFALTKAEMGQGIMTGYAMLVAEELELSLDQVETYFCDAIPEHAPLMTSSSSSMMEGYKTIRRAAASARIMLIAAAAAQWDVDAQSCQLRNRAVHHPGSGRSLSFGALAGAAAEQPVPDQPPLKSPDTFKLIGTDARRVDNRAKVTGTAQFGMDVQVPGMLRALVIHPPRPGATATRVEAEAARAMDGVVDVVTFERGVAIVAEKYWQARRARGLVQIRWSAGEDSFNTSSMHQQLATRSLDSVQASRNDGDVDAALAAPGVTKIEAHYETPYLAHAPMEPQNCVAHVRDGGCEIWAPTQGATACQEVAAHLLGCPRKQVIVHTTFLGGGFGRRAMGDFIADAVLLSKRMLAPVQVLWTREADTRGGFYRPASYTTMRGALDKSGAPIAFDYHSQSQPITSEMGELFPSVFPDWLPTAMRWGIGRRAGKMLSSNAITADFLATEGATGLPYAIQNVRVRYTPFQTPLSVCFWRSVGHSSNGFIVESFMDELAHAAGQDPYLFRRDLLPAGSRDRAVLEAAAALGRWDEPPPKGYARGIAAHPSFRSHCAQVVEAGIEDGQIRVRRVSCVLDCGRAINPDLVKAQMESSIVYGLSAALWQQITVEGGEVQEGNFDSYRIMRMHECPEIDIQLIDSQQPPGGVGEPGLPPVGPALANALFAATGVRLRSMPLQQAWDERARSSS